jgi:hypothetical protein
LLFAKHTYWLSNDLSHAKTHINLHVTVWPNSLLVVPISDRERQRNYGFLWLSAEAEDVFNPASVELASLFSSWLSPLIAQFIIGSRPGQSRAIERDLGERLEKAHARTRVLRFEKRPA